MKIPVAFPPTIVISSARLAFLCFGEMGGLEEGERVGILRDLEELAATDEDDATWTTWKGLAKISPLSITKTFYWFCAP